jgi:hypothetical protein
MNTYRKYCPCVYVAECDELHEKGETITVTTQYGKENKCVVWNKVAERNGKYYYSITRVDGYNVQERARQKAERYEGWSASADAKSCEHCTAATDAVKDIPFGQPVLVDHYSAKRMRRDHELSDNHMRKSVELMNKAEAHSNKAEYWKSMEGKIDLSMPESIEYYKNKLEQAVRLHEGLKNGTIPREYGMQLQYAKKAVNEAKNNYDTAVKLWGEV